MEAACQEVLAAHVLRVGFDMEWRVKFKTGEAPCPVALIQLCYKLGPADATPAQSAVSAAHSDTREVPARADKQCSAAPRARGSAPALPAGPGASAVPGWQVARAQSAPLGKRRRSDGAEHIQTNAGNHMQHARSCEWPGSNATSAHAGAGHDCKDHGDRRPLHPTQSDQNHKRGTAAPGSSKLNPGLAGTAGPRPHFRCLLLHVHHSGMSQRVCSHWHCYLSRALTLHHLGAAHGHDAVLCQGLATWSASACARS